jgi:hypothetical protein
MNGSQVPTGNSSEVVQQYYDYLYNHYLAQIDQNYYIHWDTLGWFALWLIILVGGFYAYTRGQRTTRATREPYPLESYNGYIQDGNGPVGLFLTIFFTGVVIWLLVTTALNLLRGQIY